MAEVTDVPKGAAKGAGAAIKRVPKWAWVAGAGVTGGILFYRMKERNTSTASIPTNSTSPVDGTSVADSGLTYQGFSGGGVTTPGFSGDVTPQQIGFSASDLATIIDSLTGNQTAKEPTVPVAALPTLFDSMVGAGGGGAPQSAATAAPPAPPAAAPAPPPPPPPPPAPADPCPGAEFPFSGPGGCYKVVCASGAGIAKGRWHFYANGTKQHVSNVC